MDVTPDGLSSANIRLIAKWERKRKPEYPVFMPQPRENIERVLAQRREVKEKDPHLYSSPHAIDKVIVPISYPPEPMDHRAALPCDICVPPPRSKIRKRPITFVPAERGSYGCCVPVEKKVLITNRCRVQPDAPQVPGEQDSTLFFTYYEPQPPCVEHYNNPCGVHERQEPTLKIYRKLAYPHTEFR
jgi:hypothetical protein